MKYSIVTACMAFLTWQFVDAFIVPINGNRVMGTALLMNMNEPNEILHIDVIAIDGIPLHG